MRDFLGILSAGIGFLILFALANAYNVEPKTFAVVSDEVVAQKLVPVDTDEPPTTLVMPTPVTINSLTELTNIPDLKIKNYVRKNGNFRKNQVLYYEWVGHKEEKLTGEKVAIEGKTDEYKYLIKYYCCNSCGKNDAVVHRQVFLIPKEMPYFMEMENLAK